ncbi:MAG: aldehyde dehydrogenase iron-sulfur subunit, partial [Bryobacteraceae bacterium]
MNKEEFEQAHDALAVSRRAFVGTALAGAVTAVPAESAQAPLPASNSLECSLTINGEAHKLTIDSRTTLLDLLREHLQMT